MVHVLFLLSLHLTVTTATVPTSVPGLFDLTSLTSLWVGPLERFFENHTEHTSKTDDMVEILLWTMKIIHAEQNRVNLHNHRQPLTTIDLFALRARVEIKKLVAIGTGRSLSSVVCCLVVYGGVRKYARTTGVGGASNLRQKVMSACWNERPQAFWRCFRLYHGVKRPRASRRDNANGVRRRSRCSPTRVVCFCSRLPHISSASAASEKWV